MISLDPLGNLDTWTEILKYLDVSLDRDSKDELRTKRQALFRTALLSPLLTTYALDALWKSMTSLEPIAHIINSDAVSPDLHMLQFQTDNSGGYWSLKNPLTTSDRKRVAGYLSRIQYMQVTVGPSQWKEMGLWATLSAALCRNFSAPLLPEMQRLLLDFSQAGNAGIGWIYAIYPLLSPSLTAISYSRVSPVHSAGADTLQAVLKSQSLDLSSIAFDGFPSTSLLHTCLAFGGLTALKISCDRSQPAPQRYAIGPTIFEAFEKLQSLRDFEIDLRVFRLRDSTSSSDVTASTLTPAISLSNLRIAGDASDIAAFLSNGVRSPSLVSLSVTFFQPSGLVWRAFCDRIVCNFPKLQSLGFHRAGGGLQQLLLQDVSSLLSQVSMQSFVLDGIPHCLNEVNLCGLMDCWPKLHTLTLSDASSYFSPSLLRRISQANLLQQVELPIDLSRMGDTIPGDAALVAHSRVRAFTFTNIAGAPTELERKINIARNLWVLFPALEKLSTPVATFQAFLRELEGLISSFRQVIITYLRRREFEKRSTKSLPSADNKESEGSMRPTLSSETELEISSNT